MSKVYLGIDAEPLAERWAQLIEPGSREDFFAPATVVVPHQYLGKWLRLGLARKTGVAINLRFQYLENALWEMFRAIDPRKHPAEPELLDNETYRLLVLAALQEENPALAAFQSYLRRDGKGNRNYWRRSWHLADHLARFIRDYEYHRQDTLIQNWLKDLPGISGTGSERMEAGQREVFRRIVDPERGLRALLEQKTGKVLKTLPQYAMEVMEFPIPTGQRRQVHLFGITQISALHIRTLHWLGARYDLRVYYLNPLAGRSKNPGESATPAQWRTQLRELAEKYRRTDLQLREGGTDRQSVPQTQTSGLSVPQTQTSRTDCLSVLQTSQSVPRGEALWTAWGQAGAESLWLMSDLLADPNPFEVELVLPLEEKKVSTVLGRVQADLRGGGSGEPVRQAQDLSLQLAACPGIQREVETVYNSILDNLQHHPGLKQTDIALLVTDMEKYRPVIQGVFEREPRRLSFNLAKFSAMGQSSFGRGVLGFLDLALEAFTRSRVFGVLTNPCFLARLGVDRDQAMTWLGWAENLGIYHGWDGKDKEERGYANSPFFGWRLGLQRLRLGRLMESTPPAGDGLTPRFQDVVPYADLASGDKDQLDAFCRAVEGLLPALLRWRGFQGTGEQWAAEIEKLAQNTLAIPPNRPEEEAVRDQVFKGLRSLAYLDRLQSPGQPARLPLALVREMVRGRLQGLEGTRGEYLTGGITVSPLSMLRFVPFRMVYLLGLGEELFPGSNTLESFDLRGRHRLPGDIRPAEYNRFLFLEALLAAREKIYLFYNCRELQRDQELQPAVPLAQLRRYLDENVLENKFAPAAVPLSGLDDRYLFTHPGPGPHDVVVNYNEVERGLALDEARRDNRILLDPRNLARLDKKIKEHRKSFALEIGPNRNGSIPAFTIPILELRRFLLDPAEASLRRHLRLEDEEIVEKGDDEPFLTDEERNLMRPTLEWFVDRTVKEGLKAGLRGWRQQFAELYRERQLRCRAPEGAFADVDQAALEEIIEERISGNGRLASLLRRLVKIPFQGPVLLGESLTPVQARVRFPAQELNFDPDLYGPEKVRLVGSQPRVWRSEKYLEILVLNHAQGKNVPQGDLSRPALEPLLFFLALKLGVAAGPEGVSARDWLGDRKLVLHLAHAQGITRLIYRIDLIQPEHAENYLKDLIQDLLDGDGFETLPFLILADDFHHLKVYKEKETKLSMTSEQYQKAWENALEQEREKGEFSKISRGGLVELLGDRIPPDALARIHRRFRLLYRRLVRPPKKGKVRGKHQPGPTSGS